MKREPLIIHHDPERLVGVVGACCPGLIVLDGCYGAGKTFLADFLAIRLRAEPLHVDAYVESGQNCYVPALRITDLKMAISAARMRSQILILEGVCARDVLEKAALAPTVFVYVQRASAVNGIPGDLDILDQEEECATPYASDDPFDLEIAAYHRKWKPRRNADIIFNRLE